MKSLEIDCQLKAECGRDLVTLIARGKTAVLSSRFGSRNGALQLLRLFLKCKNVAKTFHAQCDAQQFAVKVELGDRQVMNLGYGSRPGVVSRLLGVDPIEIKTGSLCGALLESLLGIKQRSEIPKF